MIVHEFQPSNKHFITLGLLQMCVCVMSIYQAACQTLTAGLLFFSKRLLLVFHSCYGFIELESNSSGSQEERLLASSSLSSARHTRPWSLTWEMNQQAFLAEHCILCKHWRTAIEWAGTLSTTGRANSAYSRSVIFYTNQGTKSKTLLTHSSCRVPLGIIVRICHNVGDSLEIKKDFTNYCITG